MGTLGRIEFETMWVCELATISFSRFLLMLTVTGLAWAEVLVRQGDEQTEPIGTNQSRERNGANNVGENDSNDTTGAATSSFLHLMAFPVFDLATGVEVIAEEDEEEMVPRALFRRRRKLFLGVALISLGFVAAVVGGVCGHGSGQCRRRSHTVSTTAIASSTAPTPMPIRRPTDVPSRVPSVSSKDLPSTRPSAVVSRQPSAIPSVVPAKSPASVIPSVVTAQNPAIGGVPSNTSTTNVPTNTKASSRSPTKLRATTNGPASAVPTKPIASISPQEECTLFGCYLRNLESRTEIRLSLANPTSYVVRSDGSFASSRYSIRCVASDNVQFIDYYTGGDTFDAPLWFVHREHEAPFWMHSNSESWIEPVPWLSQCEEDLSIPTMIKTVRVALGTSEASFQLTVHCNGSRH